MPLPTCDQTGCPETALSFGRHCWNHADRERYPSQLREGLRNLGPGQHRLWLKKVCADNIDFSDRSLAGSCLSQSHLNNCSFIGADLTEADLIGARITNYDPVVPFSDLEVFKNKIPNAVARVFEDRKHFNGEEFPELVDDIKSIK
jgi:hypothetical protein